nr:rod shape-determining protein [Eubacterium sp.]
MIAEIGDAKIVFGLDIGTRNVVGTVGYKDEDEKFHVLAQHAIAHTSRAMLDGQIHDITAVGKTCLKVKEALEEKTGKTLQDVCIAAAGRVLKTVTTEVELEFDEETVVVADHIHTLDLLGVEKASEILNENNDTKFKFYSVGYSTIHYYVNGDPMSNLIGHKVTKISESIIVTFLPEDVVDGLYTAVGLAGLSVYNMTLEPIAAINIAIPKSYRMLNIALVDVGAGTSDISITNEGTIIAYGMIPKAGDELTDALVQKYLVDFETAETMKLSCSNADTVDFEDILKLPHRLKSDEIIETMQPVIDDMTKSIADRIKELNGGSPVSAVFVVGGGGRVKGFTDAIAANLDIPSERVALRGEEVLGDVIFDNEDLRKDSLIVTPVGICLSAYEQKNNFIFVHFNGERLKLYDNDKLTVVDAAVQAGFANEDLFPKSGKELKFTINGKQRLIRGSRGEAAVITINGEPAAIGDPIEANCDIEIIGSTEGTPASYSIEQLEEYNTDNLSFMVNGHMVICPKFAEVNGELVSQFYDIQDGDRIELRNYYTIQQLMEFMDVELDMDKEILVNNK